MKINISIDLTPEEFRKLMGWPDVQGFQEDMLKQIREQMASGAEGYDPLSLMQPYFNQSVSAMEAFQKMMGGMMQGYGRTGKSDSE